jgi:hypothetical protein
LQPYHFTLSFTTFLGGKNSPGSFTIIFRKGVVVTPRSTDLLRIALRQFSRSSMAKAHALNKEERIGSEFCLTFCEDTTTFEKSDIHTYMSNK